MSKGHLCSGICLKCEQGESIEYVNLDNDRELCSDCYSIAIMDPKKCKLLIKKVREFYKSLNLIVNEDIPILLVDKNEMSRIAPARKGFVAVGMTVWRTCAINRIEKCTQNGENIQVEITSTVTTSGPKILLLFGQTDVMMGGTLAHEMMHAWLREVQDCRKLERRFEEGICQVMNHMWMESFSDFCSSIGVASSNKSNKKIEYRKYLKDIYTSYVEIREDEIYGQGFKEINGFVEKFGLQTTLHLLIQIGTQKNHLYFSKLSPNPIPKPELKPNQNLPKRRGRDRGHCRPRPRLGRG